MSKLTRIQRKRTKGWRMPPNMVYVGRPTRWGNPFLLSGDMIYCDASHRRTILSPWVIYDHDKPYSPEDGIAKIIELYEQWIFGKLVADNIVKPPPMDIGDTIMALRGKNLACWCPLSQPCHADMLVDLVNYERYGI